MDPDSLREYVIIPLDQTRGEAYTVTLITGPDEMEELAEHAAQQGLKVGEYWIAKAVHIGRDTFY